MFSYPYQNLCFTKECVPDSQYQCRFHDVITVTTKRDFTRQPRSEEHHRLVAWIAIARDNNSSPIRDLHSSIHITLRQPSSRDRISNLWYQIVINCHCPQWQARARQHDLLVPAPVQTRATLATSARLKIAALKRTRQSAERRLVPRRHWKRRV